MDGTNTLQLVREYFAAYEAKDEDKIRSLLGGDFAFSSPRDNRIDKEAYIRRCWPFSAQVKAFHIEKLVGSGDEAFVQYECEPAFGARFRNMEHFRIEEWETTTVGRTGDENRVEEGLVGNYT